MSLLGRPLSVMILSSESWNINLGGQFIISVISSVQMGDLLIVFGL